MIDGVIIKNIESNEDDRGFFREIFKLKDNNNIKISQVSHSLVKEQVIKGWHGHQLQHQWNYILSGSANIILYDDRIDSPTYTEKQQFTIDSISENMYYYFPPGVLHGYKCTKGPMHIIYATSGLYDLNEEIRKDLSYKNLDSHLSL
tara:strand:+ start:97 stop:537 length:441 start_codon:yes stop_codon:yes gene_type:complete